MKTFLNSGLTDFVEHVARLGEESVLVAVDQDFGVRFRTACRPEGGDEFIERDGIFVPSERAFLGDRDGHCASWDRAVRRFRTGEG